MDNLLVDLDKVLDDFEAEENEAPGNERKPSGFHEFLEKSNEQTIKVIDNYIPSTEVPQNDQNVASQAADITQNVCYDFPYEPENFDISEADFAPSPKFSDTGYNGSLSYSAYDGQKLTKSLVKGTIVENQSVTSSSFESSDSSLQNGNNVMSKDSSVIKNDLQPGKFKLTFPIQADNSPTTDRIYHSGELNGYGNYQWTDSLLPKQNNSDTNLEQQSTERQVSVQSLSSNDPDKYPVQCNTPQTPKENMFNPLETQISSLNSLNNTGASSNSSHNSMQGNDGDLDPKLAHLKNDMAEDLAKGTLSEMNKDKNVCLNASNSLPASFYANLNEQNERQSSLPINLTNGTQEVPCADETDMNNTTGKTKAYDQSEINIITDNDRRDIHEHVEPNQDQKVQNGLIEAKGEQSVVGFGLVDDVMEESGMDDYLKDVEMSDKTVTDTMAYTLGDDDVMDEQGGEKVSSVVHKGNAQLCYGNGVDLEKKSDNNKQGYQPYGSVGEFAAVTNKTDGLNNTHELGGKSDIIHSVQRNAGFNQMISPSSDVIQVLPTELDMAAYGVTNSKSVIANPDTNLSPSALVSIDSGVASMTDNVTDSGSFPSPVMEVQADVGARPKDINNMTSRSGVSEAGLDPQFVLQPSKSPPTGESTRSEDSAKIDNLVQNDFIQQTQSELGLGMETDQVTVNTDNVEAMETLVQNRSNVESQVSDSSVDLETVNLDNVELRRPHNSQGGAGQGPTGRPRSWSPADSGQPPVQKQKRPTSLNLPPIPQISLNERSSPDEDGYVEGLVETEPEEGDGRTEVSNTGDDADLNDDSLEGAVGGEDIPYIPPVNLEDDFPPSYSSTLGKVAPKWIPDAEAHSCMSCDSKFTFTKRRHHCRACGKIFCSACCNMKARLFHLKNQEARVCMLCHQELSIGQRGHEGDVQRGVHPNNPVDYCSMVPPEQAASSAQPHPAVLVPVLKRDGNNRRGEPKQVMFSDGIRPGGDLTELDGSSEVTKLPPRRSRVQKRVEKVSTGGQHSSRSRHIRTVAERNLECFIPEVGLPPVMVPVKDGIDFDMQWNPDPTDMMTKIKDEECPYVRFAVNPNLHVLVKIIRLDCCVNRVVWCFTTTGMTSVGQEDIVTVLEVIPDETDIPKDIFTHLNSVYDEASKGNPVTELSHTIFNQSFLDSRDHGGFLYIRSTFQCTQKLILTGPPYLYGILLQKWETPWAKVFPIRLLLRLGAEFRYYPCPLIGVRNRKPVFFEIGHTIMNLLADFRNFQYMLPTIKGITIHMEDKVTKINFPRNTYEDLMKVVNNSNEHVMAVAANFSPDADSHLVCIQNDDGNYQTQAINIQNKPRKVTGASFVVFNGALKTSSGLTAKSSIVEDGLMVQISPDSMLALKQSMKDMRDYTITCAVIGATKPDETVIVRWIEDDKNVNIGVRSPIDSMRMDGIESLRIQNSVDYVGERYFIRWTEIFFIQNKEGGSSRWDPVDLNRLGETLATAFCVALTPHLQSLRAKDLKTIGLRVTLGVDNVGYEAGAGGERLSDVYTNDLDNELIPVIHRATQADGSIVLEMICQVLE